MWRVPVESGTACGVGTKHESHTFAVTTGAETLEQTILLEEGREGCSAGRRPARLVALRQHAANDACGRFFARLAQLEAASVVAFERLEAELRELGAPEGLVEAARASRDDEVRHAKMMAGLSRRFGARRVEAPAVMDVAERSAFEIALENAVEGCVRETFGALVAHWQAHAARDEAVARAMRIIAEDETRHAALAWDVATWLEPRLTAEERRAVDAARVEAIASLRAEIAADATDEQLGLAGMPNGRQSSELLDGLAGQFLRAA